MAKLSKRQRAEQKRKQQNKLVRQGFKRQEVEHISNKDLQKLAANSIPQSKTQNVDTALKYLKRKEQNRKASKRHREKLLKQREEKFEILEKIIGTDRLNFKKKPTAKFIDSLKLEDLKKGKYKRRDLLEYIPEDKRKPIDTFDFEKEYEIPGGKKLHFAFRALNGEKDIEEELRRFSRYSNEELIDFLRSIKNMPLTASKRQKGKKGRSVGSSGQAGEAMIKLNSQDALKDVYGKEYNDDRRANNFSKLLAKTAKKKGVDFQHSGVDYHWQSIKQKDDQGRLKAYTKISARKLLIIGNAILWNITERDRQGFYREFYSICVEIIPELKHILP